MSVDFLLAGDVASFEAESFRSALHEVFANATEIRVNVLSSSVTVETRIVMSSVVEANSVARTITSTPIATMQTSWFGNLSVVIERIPTPLVAAESGPIESQPPPSPVAAEPLPSGATQALRASSGSEAPALAAEASLLMVVGCAMLLPLVMLVARGMCLRWRGACRRRFRSVYVSAAEVRLTLPRGPRFWPSLWPARPGPVLPPGKPPVRAPLSDRPGPAILRQGGPIRTEESHRV